MAAPTPTVRQVPTGYKEPDGFRTTITFSSKPSIQLWERTVKPPAIDGGDAIDTVTMLNAKYRTKAARKLISIGDVTASCAYDPDVIADILNQINKEQTITVTFPDGSTICFFGFMRIWDPQEDREGEFPAANITVVATNWDNVNGVEAGPVFTAAVGT